jgi:hypothetical protein
MVIAVMNAEGMPREKVPRRVRVTTRKDPNVVAGDYVALKARLLPPSHAALPGGYDFARDEGERGEERRQRGGQPEDRLAIGREITILQFARTVMAHCPSRSPLSA